MVETTRVYVRHQMPEHGAPHTCSGPLGRVSCAWIEQIPQFTRQRHITLPDCNLIAFGRELQHTLATAQRTWLWYRLLQFCSGLAFPSPILRVQESRSTGTPTCWTSREVSLGPSMASRSARSELVMGDGRLRANAATSVRAASARTAAR